MANDQTIDLERRQAAATIRAKITELNMAVSDAANLKVQVEYETLFLNSLAGEIPVLSAEIKVVI